MSNQPKWKFLDNLGDAHPLTYGGFFVYVDETGVYPPEAEVLLLDDESDDPHYTAHRFSLDKCTFINGVLSDNRFHPDHPAWWAKPESEKINRPQDTTYMSGICSTMDVQYEELVRLFCSDDPLERAEAYRCVGEYHGYHNLDDYPLKLRKREARNRYKEKNGIKYN